MGEHVHKVRFGLVEYLAIIFIISNNNIAQNSRQPNEGHSSL